MKIIFILWIFIIIPINGQELILVPTNETQIRSLGRSLVVTCIYKASGSFRELSWYDNNDVLITERTASDPIRIYVEEGKSQKKLYITSINKFDGGVYTCKHTDDNFNTLQKSIRLNIYKEISFSNVPEVQNFSLNSEALIICDVNGQPLPEVTWRLKGSKIKLGEKYIKDPRGLLIKNIEHHDAGNYTCRAEVESDGRYDEKHIQVNIQEIPIFIKTLSNVNASNATDISLSCEATGLPKPSYKFLKGGVQILNLGDRILVDVDLGFLYLNPVIRSDEGEYECVAFNSIGSVTSKALLTVFLSPLIEPMKNVTAKEEGSAVFRCLVASFPTAYISFYHNGEDVSTMSFESMKGFDPKEKYMLEVNDREVRVLTIMKISRLDAGEVMCRAQNEIGASDTSAFLIVQFGPIFSSQNELKSPEIVYGWADHTSKFSCIVESDPPSTILWYRGDQMIKNGTSQAFHIIEMDQASYLMLSFKMEDQGTIYGSYSCIATNAIGKATKNFTLRRATTPDVPQVLMEPSIFPTSVILNLSPPLDDGGERSMAYRVEYEDKATEFPIGSKILIDNLTPSTNYKFRIRMRNKVGLGLPSEIQLTTLPKRIPYPVEIISNPIGHKRHSYTLIWREPIYSGLPIKLYKISYRLVKVDEISMNISEPLEAWHIIRKSVEYLRNTTESLLLNNLAPASHYEVVIQSHNELGFSEPNPSFVFLTTNEVISPSTVKGSIIKPNLTSEKMDNQTDIIYSGEELVEYELNPPLTSSASLSSGALVAIFFVVMVLFFIIVDVSCYRMNGCGATMFFCTKVLKNKNARSQRRLSQAVDSERKMLSYSDEDSSQSRLKYENGSNNHSKNLQNKSENLLTSPQHHLPSTSQSSNNESQF